jgi:phenylpyruvate tautomerase PptA (4-oxalocrotonate tautomerase family)
MPYLIVTSNQKLDTDSLQLNILSETVSRGLHKPESYVMVSVQHNPDMLFAGTKEPLAFCELKSLGLQESQTAELSNRLCHCLNTLYGIPTSRIYIEFSAPPRSMWGWDAKTF